LENILAGGWLPSLNPVNVQEEEDREDGLRALSNWASKTWLLLRLIFVESHFSDIPVRQSYSKTNGKACSFSLALSPALDCLARISF
jgi:hypothetical protein